MTTSRPTEFRRPPTTQQAVLAEMRRAIGLGEIRPGQQIVQEALAQRFGVSRVPLREALKILEGEGQVVYRPRRGYYVADMSLEDLREVYRIRQLLETEGLRVALPRIDQDDISRLESVNAEMERAADAGDVAGMTAANREFHFLLLEHSGMPRLVRLIRILWDATDVYRSVYYHDENHRRRVREEHRAILEAIRRRDLTALLEHVDAHRANAVRALGETLSPS